LIEKQD